MSKMKKKKISGIYKIWFEGDCRDKCYIGSSIDVNTRIRSHIEQLLSGNHKNILLSNAMLEHGAINLRFELLEDMTERKMEEILETESNYIKKFKSSTFGYNVASYTTNSTFKETFTYNLNKNKNDLLNMINNFKSSHKVELRLADSNYFIQGEMRNVNYSRGWYEKLNSTDFYKLLSGCEYIFRKKNIGRKNYIIAMPTYYTLEYIKKLTKDHHSVIPSMLGDGDRALNKTITSVLVVGLFNPLFTEMNQMKKNGILNLYRASCLIRFLETYKLDKGLTLYMPPYIYNELKDIFE